MLEHVYFQHENDTKINFEFHIQNIATKQNTRSVSSTLSANASGTHKKAQVYITFQKYNTLHPTSKKNAHKGLKRCAVRYFAILRILSGWNRHCTKRGGLNRKKKKNNDLQIGCVAQSHDQEKKYHIDKATCQKKNAAARKNATHTLSAHNTRQFPQKSVGLRLYFQRVVLLDQRIHDVRSSLQAKSSDF